MTTHRLLRNFLVCVPESQAADYETVTPGHVVTHRDSVRGLTPKLNWMFDHLADDEGIVFLDDDLEYICRCFTDPTEAAARKVTDPATVEAVIAQTLAIAAGVGAYYFGLKNLAPNERGHFAVRRLCSANDEAHRACGPEDIR